MELSFASFVQQVFSSPAMLVTVLLTLGVIFVNGWTDAPNAIATCIATRCINVRAAILTSAVFNFLGVLIMTHINSSVASTISNMVDFGGNTHEALIALCAALFSIVVYSVGGEKIIKSVGMDMVRLEKYQGFAADLAAAACLLLSSLFGIPVSTTHTKTSAIMGVGAVKRLSAINFGVVKDMMLTWVFTFPGCGLISFVMAKIFTAIF